MKFQNVSCSQCGEDFGPGDHGFSYCKNHRNRVLIAPSISGMRLARRAIKLWNCDLVPKATNRHNQKAWLSSVQQLGPKWLLASPVTRKAGNGTSAN